MKKYLKLSLFTIFIFLFSFLNVSAEENVELVKVELQEKSEYVEINEEVSLDGNKILSNVNFFDEGDYVIYKFTIKNNDERDYKISDIFDDNESEYLDFQYIYDEFIGAKEEKEVLLKITYKSQLPYDAVLTPENEFNAVNEISISVELEEVVINPSTFDNVSLYLILEVIGVISLLVIFIKLKKKNAVLLLILAMILIPKTTNAKIDFKINFTFKNTMNLKVNYLDKYWKNNITDTYNKIEFVKTNSFPEGAVDVSKKQDGSIMAWVKDETVYIGSRYKIFFPENSAYLLSMSQIQNINFNDRIDTTFVKDMTAMFSYDELLTEIDLSSFRTGNVTDMTAMFYGCKKIENYDLSNFDTSNVTDFSSMFSDNISIKYMDLSNFNTSKLNSYGYMLAWCTNLESVNIDNWNFTNMNFGSSLFAGTSSLKEISAKNWILPSNVADMYSSFSFYNSPLEKMDVTGWDLSKVTSLREFFKNFKYLKEIKGLDTWDTSNISNMQDMFFGCTSLEKLDLSTFKMENVTTLYSIFYNCSSLEELIIDNWDLSSLNHSIAINEGCNNLKIISARNMILPKNASNFFRNYGSTSTLESIDLTGSDASNTTSLYAMFQNQYYLKEIKGIKDWDTSKVTNIEYIFYSTGQNSDEIKIDISGWNMPLVTSFNYAFNNFGGYANYVEINASDINLSGATRGDEVFKSVGNNAKKVKLNIPNWNISSIASMSMPFADIDAEEIEINAEGWDLRSINSTEWFFENITDSETTKVIINLKNWNISSATSTKKMFYNSTYGTELIELDLTGWITSNLEETSDMFYFFGAGNTGTITIKGLETWDTSKVTKMDGMFYSTAQRAQKVSLNISGWDVSNVTNFKYMFQNFARNVQEISIGDLSNWNVNSEADMSSMFYHCGANATGVLDLGTLKLNNKVTSSMFGYVQNLKVTLEIRNLLSDYSSMLNHAALIDGSGVIVNYTEDVTNIDDIVASKYSDEANVIKGELIE